MSGEPEPYRIRPYARLLTMLGEQLIKNDRIALVELIKNCYDADATKVEIRFENFKENLATTAKSRIVISDNGDGMTFDVVRDHWLNPATDIKKNRKKDGKSVTTGGRVIQGEKGIGRFAMFKLGSAVELVTRAAGGASETTASIDISFLDDAESESISGADSQSSHQVEGHAEADDIRFLDELSADLQERAPTLFTGDGKSAAKGTQLTISNLRGAWSKAALEALHADLLRLRPLRSLVTGAAGTDPLGFEVTYEINGRPPQGLDEPEALLESLAPRAVLTVVGSYDAQSNAFDLLVNGEDRTVVADSDEIRALSMYSRLFGKTRPHHQFVCGDFSFEFLVFDIRANADVEHNLNPVERKIIKDHRIYLYRDNVRVLPYGDPDDDWLQLDTIRGTVGANRVLSNDQTVGFVYISQAANPDLRDKTNREGLIDSGPAYSDFLSLIQLLISYLRKGDYARHLADWKSRRDSENDKQIRTIDARIEEIRRSAADNPALQRQIDQFADAYETERTVVRQRLELTEDLAGIGLSVETASHDVVAAANQAFREAGILNEQLGYELGKDSEITKRASRVSSSLSFIVSRLQDVQGLFVSSRAGAKDLDVAQYVRKIESIYARPIRESGIKIELTGDHSLVIRTHAATLLQIFLNLFDNAIYWLQIADVPEPTISIHLDNELQTAEFTDNGPGIAARDLPYMFDPFYSGKGDDGRGLGLYISRQVARRDRLELEHVGPPTPGTDRAPAAFKLSVRPK